MEDRRELIQAYLKKLFIISVDICLVLILLPIALYLRLESNDFKVYMTFLYPDYYFLCLVSYLSAFIFLKTHRVIFRIANIFTGMRLALGAFLGAAIFYVLSLQTIQLHPLPRSVYIIQFLLFAPTGCFFRFSFRIKDSFSHRFFKKGIPTLIYGAGVNTSRMVTSLLSSHSDFRIIGIIDDAIFKIGSDVQGIKVLGSGKDIYKFIKKHKIEQIIISMPGAPGEKVRALVHDFLGYNLKVKILPSLENTFVDPEDTKDIVRDLKIEDLLKRAPRTINMPKIKGTLENKIILITGAGGSIGSELVRQILQLSPSEIIMNDFSEFSLYKISEEVTKIFPHIKIHTSLSNIADAFSCSNLFKKYPIDIVFHACAYKHVPLVESDVSTAVLNNIKSAFNIFSNAAQNNIEKVILISSDKAVKPTNVMGATKRICELYSLWFAQHSKSATKFASVRFGNVLGSNGSVVPKFIEQIKSGGPVTITHPEITRYFMLIPEAVSLVLQAATTNISGEIFVLNMGSPIKIIDMAKEMISLMGKKINVDINIEFIGLRPGEKLHEELNLECEQIEPINSDYSRIKSEIIIDREFNIKIENILTEAKEGHDHLVKKMIFDLINEYEANAIEKNIPSHSINGEIYTSQNTEQSLMDHKQSIL